MEARENDNTTSSSSSSNNSNISGTNNDCTRNKRITSFPTRRARTARGTKYLTITWDNLAEYLVNSCLQARENSAWYEVERRLAKIAEREGERRRSKRTHLLEDTKVSLGSGLGLGLGLGLG